MKVIKIKCFKDYENFNKNYNELSFPMVYKSLFDVNLYTNFRDIWGNLVNDFDRLTIDLYRCFTIEDSNIILCRDFHGRFYLHFIDTEDEED